MRCSNFLEPGFFFLLLVRFGAAVLSDRRFTITFSRLDVFPEDGLRLKQGAASVREVT